MLRDRCHWPVCENEGWARGQGRVEGTGFITGGEAAGGRGPVGTEWGRGGPLGSESGLSPLLSAAGRGSWPMRTPTERPRGEVTNQRRPQPAALSSWAAGPAYTSSLSSHGKGGLQQPFSRGRRGEKRPDDNTRGSVTRSCHKTRSTRTSLWGIKTCFWKRH